MGKGVTFEDRVANAIMSHCTYLPQTQKLFNAIAGIVQKEKEAKIERLQDAFEKQVPAAKFGQTMLTMLEGMTAPEIREGEDPVDGYIRVYERQKVEIEWLRSLVSRPHKMKGLKAHVKRRVQNWAYFFPAGTDVEITAVQLSLKHADGKEMTGVPARFVTVFDEAAEAVEGGK